MSKEKLIARTINFFAHILFLTVRLKVDDRVNLHGAHHDRPTLITFWHNRILAITLTFLRHYPFGVRKGVVVLTSPSRDGKLLAEVARGFGMEAVFGSNNKKPLQAITQSATITKEGKDLAITPDGPRGPCYHLNPGVIFLSQKENIPILPVHAHFSRSIRLKSWDQFRIPFPFSRIDVTIGPYEWISATDSEEAFEAERLRIEKILKDEAD
jgi:lysophospholipid acyltransferase (LPLAT)-like uncharacterized protein